MPDFPHVGLDATHARTMRKHSMRTDLGEEAVEMIAARFRVLGEASRLKLIMALENGEKNVSALVALTGQTQANASRQLQALTEAGILGRRKAGLNVFYRLTDKSIFDMCDHVCGSLHRRIDSHASAFLPNPAKRKRSAGG